MDLFILNNHPSDGQQPEITRLPQSSLLDRLKCFLPEMAAANAELDEQLQHSPESCNIENIPESDERVIEMNIAMFERDASSSCDEHSSESSDDTSDSDDDRDTEAATGSENCLNAAEQQLTRASPLPGIRMPRNLRKRPCRPRVEVLHSSDSANAVEEHPAINSNDKTSPK